MTQFVYDDGGRSDAGFVGNAGDCVVRSIAIAAQLPYKQVYDAMCDYHATYQLSGSGRHSARNGIDTTRKGFSDYMRSIGFTWKATMQIGSGCTTHLKSDELPAGRIIVKLSKHLCAVIDGVIHDTYDPSRDETRCVYGYWIKE